jgi:hypothetical protein
MELSAKHRVLEAQKAEHATAEASAGIWGDIASGISGAFSSALTSMMQAGVTVRFGHGKNRAIYPLHIRQHYRKNCD